MLHRDIWVIIHGYVHRYLVKKLNDEFIPLVVEPNDSGLILRCKYSYLLFFGRIRQYDPYIYHFTIDKYRHNIIHVKQTRYFIRSFTPYNVVSAIIHYVP